MKVEIPNQITVTIGGLISRGVKAVEITGEGKLVFTLTDGSKADLGSVIGPEGPRGQPGPAGPAGQAGPKGETGAAGASIVSIEKASQSGTTSTYTITLSDGKTFDFEVQADKGDKGDPGAQGPKGDTGPQGETGPQGPKGDTGDTGPQGLKGDKGDTGPQGAAGTPGIVVQEQEPTGSTHPVWLNPKGGASDQNGRLPDATAADAGKFLRVDANGYAVWQKVQNANGGSF